MKFLKTSALIILIILLVITVIMLSFQSVVSVLAVPAGVLFFYYLVVFILISFLKEQKSNQILFIVVWGLFLSPILWMLISPEHLFNLITPKLYLDMK